jgi:hypothetical protein
VAYVCPLGLVQITVPSGNFLRYRLMTVSPIRPVRRTLTTVRAADAVEAIAVEVFRQAESSGQPVTMSMINRAVEALRTF